MARQRSNTQDDADRVKDANHKLRADNRSLRKENARLKKQLSKIDIQYFEQDDDEEEGEEMVFAPVRTEVKPLCPKCKSDSFVQVPAGKYLINVCKATGCGFRKRTKSGIDC